MNDLTITTAFIVKRIFPIPLKSLQKFIHAVFKCAQLPLSYPHYLCINK
ncbi:Mobile element protein [Candidatus Enterovibrio altilux]|uniref:Mobile element protein n=1 Tax=Candidatus Enterovibrio altilux TaxID=1927128 RepID=A0A291B7D0_9GAMM|nr:Mobile element protein [Candidatus Enterovibrio luxaltus]